MQLGGLSAFVQRRWGSWGILLLILLALVLTLLGLALMLFLSAVVRVSGQENMSQGRVWTIFILNALFSVGFAASVYGLWGRRNWGRLLFIGCITVWGAYYIIFLFIPAASSGNFGVGALLVNLIPVVAVITAILYLNLAHIRALFDVDRNQSSE